MKLLCLVLISFCLLIAGCSDTTTPTDANTAAPDDGSDQLGEAQGGPGGPGGPGGGGFGGRGGGGFDPAARFERADADGDGKLSGDEISGRMLENLEEIDTDGDGAITLEEFEKRMSEVMARFGGGRGGPGGGGGFGGGGDLREGRPERPQRPESEE